MWNARIVYDLLEKDNMDHNKESVESYHHGFVIIHYHDKTTMK